MKLLQQILGQKGQKGVFGGANAIIVARTLILILVQLGGYQMIRNDGPTARVVDERLLLAREKTKILFPRGGRRRVP